MGPRRLTFLIKWLLEGIITHWAEKKNKLSSVAKLHVPPDRVTVKAGVSDRIRAVGQNQHEKF